MANESRAQQEQLSLSDEQVVDLVLNLTKTGEDEQKNRRKRYDSAYDIYRASAPRPASLEPWQSKLRVPYGRQVIDTALVNIVSGKPRVMVKPRHPDVELQAKAMQVVMDYFMAEDHFVEKTPVFTQQALVYGVTIAKNHWLYQERDRTVRSFQPGMPPLSQERGVGRDGPCFEPWNVYDAWWDGSGRDVDSSAYFVLRSWLSKEQLRSMECNVPGKHDRHECDGVFHNVDELMKVGTAVSPSSTAQSKFLGGQRDRAKNLFEVLEIWTDTTVTVLGSRKVLLRNDPNPFWHGRKPIVLAQTTPDLFEMQGIAETEAIDHLQQALWTLQNMTIDNVHLTTMRGITYREGGVTDPNALQLKPRFKWPVVDHEDIKPFEIPPIGTDVFEERRRLLADMQLVSGINPYVSGSDLQSVDQNTATGVTALQEVASRLLRFKASQLEFKGFQRSFEMWGDMIQQFLDHDVWVQIVGPSMEMAWVQLGPKEVAGHFRYVLEGSEESLSRQQERGEAIALLNAFAPLAQLGLVNFKPVLERIALAYDFPDPESLFLPQGVAPAAAPTQGQLDQQSQQGAQGSQQFYNVRSPQIGQPYARRGLQQGGLPMDSQLAAALNQIRAF